MNFRIFIVVRQTLGTINTVVLADKMKVLEPLVALTIGGFMSDSKSVVSQSDYIETKERTKEFEENFKTNFFCVFTAV